MLYAFWPFAAARADDAPQPGSAEVANVDFNRDIRVILSDKCFLCHGPDDATREADLRLDDRQVAIDLGAIVPGDPAASEILNRITSDDPDLVMPPPSTGKTINAAELEQLTNWIEQDAIYADHWAFTAPARPDAPQTKDRDWARNAIDQFVLARLEAQGMSPSPQADPESLARRIVLDLTGLPPTLQQLDQVLAAQNNTATQAETWDALIASSLDSPHFGERWGRWWLDAARYADSAGYEKDMQREVWFYRDWVTQAMNADMPYDDFIVQQIAGDLLPEAGQPERVATGFLRNSMTNEEGGADPEQFRVEGMFDRMDAIGKAILGITTQCAQCHTHKYDPLSHAEYYEMFAALNDFHEATISVYTPAQAQQRDRLEQQISDIERSTQAKIPDWREQIREWATTVADDLPEWQVMHPETVPFEGQKFEVLQDGSIISQSYAPTRATNSFSLTAEVGTIRGVRLDALTHPQLPRGGPGRSIDGTSALTEFRMTVLPIEEGAKSISVRFTRALSDVNPPQRDLKPQYRNRNPEKDDRVVGPIDFAIDGDDKTAWTTDLGPGRSNQSRHAIFVPESPIVVNGRAKMTFTLVQNHGGWNSDDNQNFLLGRYRFSITSDERLPESSVRTDVESLVRSSSDTWSDSDWQTLFSEWRLRQESLAAENQEIERLWQQYPETSTQLVAQSLGKSRPTFVFARGDFLNPLNPVEPGTPKFLHPLPDESMAPRLRFAHWLASPKSPTTARVIVNRIWQAYFGRGLVSTPEDFGFQSTAPSHPELLDYLACELMDNDWSLKHVHRLITNSATYRQTSNARPKAWQQDPDNIMLGRGPRGRVEAEMVRDIALHASGLLNLKLGGPSVYPPAPEFLFKPPTSYGPKIWKTSAGSEQYRRSLYVHQYRSVPYPPLQVFDAPKGDAACVRREQSNTPLQALVLLNEPQYIDAARSLAARVIREVASDPGTVVKSAPDEKSQAQDMLDRKRIAHVFRLCTSRRPEAQEVTWLLEHLRSQRLHFQNNDSEISKLIGVPADKCLQLTGVPAIEMAAWMTVSRVVLNLDETISKS